MGRLPKNGNRLQSTSEACDPDDIHRVTFLPLRRMPAALNPPTCGKGLKQSPQDTGSNGRPFHFKEPASSQFGAKGRILGMGTLFAQAGPAPAFDGSQKHLTNVSGSSGFA